MVYKRYIKRNGKVFGPYYYKSVRGKDGHIKSTYVEGPSDIKENKFRHKINYTTIFFVCFTLLLMLGLGSFLSSTGYLSLNTNFDSYSVGENLSGTLSLTLDSSDLVQKDSAISFELVKTADNSVVAQKEITFSDYLSESGIEPVLIEVENVSDYYFNVSGNYDLPVDNFVSYNFADAGNYLFVFSMPVFNLSFEREIVVDASLEESNNSLNVTENNSSNFSFGTFGDEFHTQADCVGEMLTESNGDSCEVYDHTSDWMCLEHYLYMDSSFLENRQCVWDYGTSHCTYDSNACGSAPSCSEDAFEDLDDSAYSTPELGTPSDVSDSSLTHTICAQLEAPNYEADWFNFSLVAGDTYRFSSTKSSMNSPQASLHEITPPNIFSYVASETDPEDFNLIYQPIETKNYYLRIYADISSPAIAYDLAYVRNIAGHWPIFTEYNFANGTTNFSAIDVNEVSGLVIANQYGKINYSASTINVSEENFDSAIEIGSRFVSVNLSSFNRSAQFNTSAIVTLNNVLCPAVIYSAPNSYSSAEGILNSGSLCNSTTSPNCTVLSCSAGVLKFSVQHFTGYASVGVSNLTIWDETDSGMPFGGQTKSSNEQVVFFANYTNNTGEYLSEATCQIWFNDSSNWRNMSWNSSYSVYAYNRSFSSSGLYAFNISCNKSGYDHVHANDSVIIIPTVADSLVPSVNISYPLNVSYSINVSSLNYTYSDSNPAYCWYSLNLGVTNSSFVSAGVNFTNVVSVEGSNTWSLYCNDSSGNLNSSSTTFFKESSFNIVQLTINSSSGTNLTSDNLTCWGKVNSSSTGNVSYYGNWYKNGIPQFSSWTRTLDFGDVDHHGSAIDVDSNDSAFLLGFYNSSSTHSLALFKYYSNGTNAWAKTYSDNVNYIESYSVVVDNADSVYLSGYNSSENTGTFIIKYDNAGTRLWINTSSRGSAKKLAVDSSNNIYAVGSSSGNFSLQKFSSAGAFSWLANLGSGIQSSFGSAVALDSSNNVYSIGVVNYTASGSFQHLFVSKHNSDGTLLWIKNYSDFPYTTHYLEDMKIDSNGDIFAVGSVNRSSWKSPILVGFNSSGDRLFNISFDAVSPVSENKFNSVFVDSWNKISAFGFYYDSSASPVIKRGYVVSYSYNRSNNQISQLWNFSGPNITAGVDEDYRFVGAVDSRARLYFGGSSSDSSPNFLIGLYYGFNLENKSLGQFFNLSTISYSSTSPGEIWKCDSHMRTNDSYLYAMSENLVVLEETVPPVIFSISPADNSFNNTENTIFFRYTVNDSSGISNCSLLLNNVINSTDDSISNNVANSFEKNLSEGYYNWSILCFDNSTLKTRGSSQGRNLTIVNASHLSYAVIVYPSSNLSVLNGSSFNFSARVYCNSSSYFNCTNIIATLDPFQVFATDYSLRTCSVAWGASCEFSYNGTDYYEPQNNTFDDCSSSPIPYYIDESVSEVYLNSTTVNPGDSINVTCAFTSMYNSGVYDNDYAYAWYYNGTGWRKIGGEWTFVSDANAPANRSTIFVVDNVIGTHWVRCGILYDSTDGDECINNASYYDNDDVNFSVEESSNGISLTINPANPGLNQSVNCTANVTSLLSIVSVRFNITLPNSSVLSLGNGSYRNGLWSNSFNSSQFGTHNCSVVVMDSDGINSSKNTNFVVGNPGVIPMNSGTPFYTTSQNPTNGSYLSCLGTLAPGAYCEVNWTVFANASIGTTWQFFAYFNGSYVETNKTNISVLGTEGDSLVPLVSIVYPLNVSYPTNVSSLNYSYYDLNPGYCWYSLTNGIVNSSAVVAGTNFTNVISISGNNNLTLYCNDSSGNQNFSSVSFFRNYVPSVDWAYLNASSLNNLTQDNLTCWANASDSDGNNLTYYGEWYKNGNVLVSEVWNRTYEGGAGDYARKIVADSSGNIYVTGYTYPGPSYYTIKYNSSGSHVWNRTISGGSSGFGFDVAIDSSDNIYVTGFSAIGGANDFFTVKYNSSGSQIWNASYNSGGTTSDSARSVAVDSSENVYVSGNLDNGVDPDYLLVKYNSSGSYVWNRTYNGGDYDDSNAVAVDSLGNIYVTGYSSLANYMYYTIKYNSSGSQIWNRSFDAGADGRANDIAVDSSNNIYVTGYFNPGSGEDYYTVKYDSSGNQLWNVSYNSGGEDSAWGIGLDSFGNVYVTGEASDRYYTIRYNSSGSSRWNMTYVSGGVSDSPYGVVADSFGNVYVTGIVYHGANSDFYTLKYNVGFVLSNQTGDKVNVSILDSNFTSGGETWSCGVYAFDGYNYSSKLISNNITIFSDSVFPSISIVYPANGTNSSNVHLNVNYTVSDNFQLDSCWYSLNYGAANTSMVCGGNLTSQTWGEGKNNVSVYANDSFGNTNSSFVSFFIDSLVPNITLVSPANNSLNAISRNISFAYNVSDASSVSNCSLILNGVVNLSNLSIVNSELNYFVQGLRNGEYLWSVNCSDSFGNVGNSVIYNLSQTNVTETTPVVESPSGSTSSGGSGGGRCVTSWNCGEWGSCASGVQTRVCSKLKESCYTSEGMPEITRDCGESTLKGAKEELISAVTEKVVEEKGLNLPWLYIGLSIGGFAVLVLLIISIKITVGLFRKWLLIYRQNKIIAAHNRAIEIARAEKRAKEIARFTKPRTSEIITRERVPTTKEHLLFRDVKNIVANGIQEGYNEVFSP